MIHFYILFVITNYVSAKRTSYSYDNSILLNCLLSLNLQSFTLLTLITLQKELKALLGHYRVTCRIDFYKSFDDNIWCINDYCGYNANLKLSAIFSKISTFQKRSGQKKITYSNIWQLFSMDIMVVISQCKKNYDGLSFISLVPLSLSISHSL